MSLAQFILGWVLLACLLGAVWMALGASVRRLPPWRCQVCGARASEPLVPLCGRCADLVEGSYAPD